MELLCSKQVGKMLGVHSRSAVKLLRSGQIRGFKPGGRVWRTTKAEIEAYIQRELAKSKRAA